jgi:FAD/FMN-containing dehydrogenase
MPLITQTQTKNTKLLEAMSQLRNSVSGGIAVPEDESYAAACHIWNAAVTHRPAVIAFCQRTEDVAAAVRIARDFRLPLSVRGGGHHWTGLALRQDGLVLDLTRMRNVVVDPRARTATIDGGAKATDVAAAADTYDLLAALGNCGSVGMAGLTLGGGYGPLIGKHGLSADNLLAAEVVLADGRCVATNSGSEPELFWALRGGGGNFGVVTSLQIQLHEKRHMLAGSILYPWNEAESVLSRYAAFAATAPEELGMFIGIASGPNGQLGLQIAPLWNGEEQRGLSVIRGLQALGTPLDAHIQPMTYSDMLAPVDAMIASKDGLHSELRTRWVSELTPGAISVMISAMTAKTSPHASLFLHPFHGAAIRVARDATAFGVRSEHLLVEIIASWDPSKSDGAPHRRWAQQFSDDLAPFSLPGGYANLLGHEDSEQARGAYGENAARLKALKCRFDPDDVFSSAIPLPN